MISPTQMLWPVYGFTEWGQRETIAIFFDWGESVNFIQHPELYSAEKRNYYQTVPQTLEEIKRAEAARRSHGFSREHQAT